MVRTGFHSEPAYAEREAKDMQAFDVLYPDKSRVLLDRLFRAEAAYDKELRRVYDPVNRAQIACDKALKRLVNKMAPVIESARKNYLEVVRISGARTSAIDGSSSNEEFKREPIEAGREKFKHELLAALRTPRTPVRVKVVAAPKSRG